MRLIRIGLLLVVLAVIGTSAASADPRLSESLAQTQQKPNFVFIVTDSYPVSVAHA